MAQFNLQKSYIKEIFAGAKGSLGTSAENVILQVQSLAKLLQESQEKIEEKVRGYVEEMQQKGLTEDQIKINLTNSVWSSLSKNNGAEEGLPPMGSELKDLVGEFTQKVDQEYDANSFDLSKYPSTIMSVPIRPSQEQIEMAEYALQTLGMPGIVMDKALQYLNSLYPEEIPTAKIPNNSNDVNNIQNTNEYGTENVMSQIAYECLPKLFGKRINLATILAATKKTNLNPLVLRSIVSGIRERNVNYLIDFTKKLRQEWVNEKKKISDLELNQLLRGVPIDLSDKNPEDVKEIAALQSKLTSKRSSLFNSSYMGGIISGDKTLRGPIKSVETDVDVSMIDVTGIEPVETSEILRAAGLVWEQYPRLPQHTVQAVTNAKQAEQVIMDCDEATKIAKEMGIDIKVAPKDAVDQFIQKYNRYRSVTTLQNAIENGDVSAGTLLKITRSANKKSLADSDFDGGTTNNIDTLIFHIFKSRCAGNKQIFASMIEEAGYTEMAEEYLGDNSSHVEDEMFTPYNLSCQSNDEVNCLNKLRNDFGLMAVCYRAGIPAPMGCPTNPKEFIVDFLAPCNVVNDWVYGVDFYNPTVKIKHPKIQSSVTFVGEYFGFSTNTAMETLKKPFPLPDGSLAQGNTYDEETHNKGDKRNYTTVPMSANARVTRGSKYDVKSEWKKMMETFVANSMGYHSIFIEPGFKDAQIMGELDKNNILYKSRVAPGPNAGIQRKSIEKHIPECKDANCDWHRFSQYFDSSPANANIPKTPSEMKNASPEEQQANAVNLERETASAYVQSALVHFQVQQGLTPVISRAYVNKGVRETEEKSGQPSQPQGIELDSPTIYAYYQKKNQISGELNAMWHQVHNEGDSSKIDAYYELYSQYKNLIHSHFGHIIEEVKTTTQNSQSYQLRETALKTLLENIKSGKVVLNPQKVQYQCNAIIYAPMERLQREKIVSTARKFNYRMVKGN